MSSQDKSPDVTAINVQSLSAGYNRHAVIDRVTVQFEAGNFYALIGPNGGGKSTLLKTLCGLLPPFEGHIKGLDADTLRARQIAYMSQTRIAHPQMKVCDIIALGREPYRRPFKSLSAADRRFIDGAVQRVGIHDLMDLAYGTLSGGQQARVHLARTLAVNAPVLLVDEPVASLDPYYQLSILQVLKDEAACGRIVVAALHDLSLVRQFASHICVMKEGRLVATGDTKSTLSDTLLKDVFRIHAVNGQFEPH